MKRIDKNAVSLAGEFAVLSRLALQNYDANMTLGRTKGVDILVSDPRTKKMYRLEVKTKLRKSNKQVSESGIFGIVIGGWPMNKKHETRADPSLFYCFVIIWKRTNECRFFIISSRVVARYVKQEHQLWLATRRRHGSERDTDMRTFRIGFKNKRYPIPTPIAERYENNWRFHG